MLPQKASKRSAKRWSRLGREGLLELPNNQVKLQQKEGKTLRLILIITLLKMRRMMKIKKTKTMRTNQEVTRSREEGAIQILKTNRESKLTLRKRHYC